MTAAALGRLLPPGAVSVRLVESEQIGTVGVGEATVPHIRFFNARLGFDEAEFMARTRATFKLGIEFRNWGRIGDRYIHPFGAYGESLEGVAFHHLWLKARAAGGKSPIGEYSLPILAALDGRFAPPDEDPGHVRSTYSYAYQFDATRYAAFLRDFAERHGVRRTEGRIIDVSRNPQNGFVEAVTLESGERLEADLFVDCSGFRGLLIGQTMESRFQDWSHWLPCDRAWAAPCRSTGPLRPYTRATADRSGWFWRIPLQHRVGNGHVYASAFCSDEEALSALISQMESEPTSEPRQLRFTAGCRERQWSGNVVAIGLASGFLEPLESTSIHLVQLAIGYLVDLFPDPGFDPVCAEEFNRIMALEYERVRDFLILHYRATQRGDTPFWNYCRTMPIPDSLAYRMELFRERGAVAQYREGMFLDASWLAVLLGQNVIPKHYDPLADRLPPERLDRHLASIRERYARAVESMPSQQDYLAETGALAASKTGGGS
jgi:tryptophan halogenase